MTVNDKILCLANYQDARFVIVDNVFDVAHYYAIQAVPNEEDIENKNKVNLTMSMVKLNLMQEECVLRRLKDGNEQYEKILKAIIRRIMIAGKHHFESNPISTPNPKLNVCKPSDYYNNLSVLLYQANMKISEDSCLFGVGKFIIFPTDVYDEYLNKVDNLITKVDTVDDESDRTLKYIGVLNTTGDSVYTSRIVRGKIIVGKKPTGNHDPGIIYVEGESKEPAPTGIRYYGISSQRLPQGRCGIFSPA